MKLELLPITKEEYNKIPEENLKGFVNFSYSRNLNGIYCNNVLVGLISLSPAFGYLSIDMMILPAYRHHGIASLVLSKIIEQGKNYPEYERFICLCSPNNIASNKLMQKLHWSADTSFDDVMLNEGGEFFNIYYRDNPYYHNLTRK